MRRISLMLLVIIILLIPQGVFAGTLTADSPAVTHAKNLIHIKMRTYRFHNVQIFGDDALFFAFHMTNENVPFGWYRLNTKKRFSRAERFLSSSEFSLLFHVAFSPSGNEMVTTSKTGEIIVQNLKTGTKRSLGAFITDLDYPQYSYPVYTPDGQYLILHDPWANSLMVISTATMDISNGTVIPGFWLTEGGGETPESGLDISMYRFSDDGTKMVFGNHQTLNLLTLTKG